MKDRCKTAKLVGASSLKDYRLLFKGHPYPGYLTIEEAKGYSVPLGVFIIEEDDEHKLDSYEGFPYFYYKKDFRIELTDFDGNKSMIDAFAYIMHEYNEVAKPSDRYLNTVLKGYDDFNFDKTIIEEAFNYSIKG